nr:endo alpha-1,4 polygalactosaminidase [Arthrobacter jiangjiafuii]
MRALWWGIGTGLLALTLAACAPAGAPADGDVAAAGTAASPAERPVADDPYWQPAPAASWQWQLSGTLDLAVDAEIFDVDYETTSPAEVDALKQQGRHTVCYLSVGSWEDFRGDAGGFPVSTRGAVMDGWPDERWLDIRRMDVLLPIMGARMDICAAKGFDAVEPDNVDGYLNETGFPLTAADQLAYNRAVAELAHARGLSVGLKNDVDQIPELVDHFDFAVNEECVRYDECDLYQPFTLAGKAVLHVEYDGALDFCAESRQRGFSSLLKPLELSAERQACPDAPA